MRHSITSHIPLDPLLTVSPIELDKFVMLLHMTLRQDAIVRCSLHRWHQHTARFIRRLDGTHPHPF